MKFRRIKYERISYSIYDGDKLMVDLGQISQEEAERELDECIACEMEDGNPYEGLHLEIDVEEIDDWEIPDEPYDRLTN